MKKVRKRLPKSIRKYLRREKAKIQKAVLDLKEKERLIQELYQKIEREYGLHQNSGSKNP